MPPKKSSTQTQPIARRRPRAPKKSVTETQPLAPEPRPVAAAPTASQWLAPVIIVLAVTLLGWLVLENQVPLDLAAAEQRLARMEAILRSTDQSGEVRDADLASAERRSRLCQEGLRSMVRMWNQYVRELREADVGSSAKFRAAKRRFDEAQKKASLAVRRCEDA